MKHLPVICSCVLLACPVTQADDLPFAESGAFSFDALDEVIDTDGDDMPDAWESANGLNPILNDASGNPDYDHLTNLQEYNGGTDPQVSDALSQANGLSSLFVYSGVNLPGDADMDGLPDYWESLYGLDGSIANANADPDEDGLTNLEEFNGGWNPIVKNDVAKLQVESLVFLADTDAYYLGFSQDTDNDNMPDWWEVQYGLNRLVNDAAGNPDGDELTNIEEYMAGRIPNLDDQFGEGADASGNFLADTAGRHPDTDKDLMPDFWETTYGLNPAVNDANGDLDNDGWTNLEEYNAGTNPAVNEWIGPDRLTSSSILVDTGAYPLGYTIDTDNDGMPDWWEDKYGLVRTTNDAAGNPDSDAYTNVEEYRRGLHPSRSDFVFVINAEGNIFLLDTGGEFIDSDIDGIPNWWERKHTGNNTAMSAIADQDNDGQDNLAEYIAGLDPRDATSVFNLESLENETDPQGKMTVRWQTQPGRTYYLHITETLTDLSGPATYTVEGDGTIKSIQVPKNGRKGLFCRLSVKLTDR